MAYLRKISIALAMAAGVALTSLPAQADYAESVETAPSAEAMAFDLIVVRPLGVVATIAGVGLFVVSLPIALFTWNLHDPAERLVVGPAKFTFARDLGEME